MRKNPETTHSEGVRDMEVLDFVRSREFPSVPDTPGERGKPAGIGSDQRSWRHMI
jgi:hypothetical protein